MIFSKQPTVQRSPAQSKGFDTDTALTDSTAAAFVKAGFVFAVRYLSLGKGESAGDLSPEETETILAAGLALMAVQHVENPGWQPTQSLGTTHGENAAGNARFADLPTGITLWMDLEGVATGTPVSDVEDYCNAWCDAVSSAGYVAGIYVGYDAILSGQDLDSLRAQLFWKACGQVPYPTQGFCLLQDISSSYVLNGVSYDYDLIQSDNLGQTPFWVSLQRPSWKIHIPWLRRAPTLSPPIPIPPRPVPAAPATPSRKLAILAAIVLALISYLAGTTTGPKAISSLKGPVLFYVAAIKSRIESLVGDKHPTGH